MQLIQLQLTYTAAGKTIFSLPRTLQLCQEHICLRTLNIGTPKKRKFNVNSSLIFLYAFSISEVSPTITMLARTVCRCLVPGVQAIQSSSLHLSPPTPVHLSPPSAGPSDRVPVTLIPGDGVGPEIMDSCQEVLQSMGAKIDFEEIYFSEVRLGRCRVFEQKHLYWSIVVMMKVYRK